MKAIITDLDGTILPSGGTISPQTLHALQTVGNRSIVRIVATGRTLFAARKFLTDDFPIDYLVFSSGAGIMEWKNKKILQAHHLSRKKPKNWLPIYGNTTSILSYNRKFRIITIFTIPIFIPLTGIISGASKSSGIMVPLSRIPKKYELQQPS